MLLICQFSKLNSLFIPYREFENVRGSPSSLLSALQKGRFFCLKMSSAFFNDEMYGLPSSFLLVQDLLFASYGRLSDTASQLREQRFIPEWDKSALI